jgi:exopolysaccharide biosynthesis polyprenyl glycosylphosphotransferase
MIRELMKRHKLLIAFWGDILTFFLSMVLILYVRYGHDSFRDQFSVHFIPFIIVLLIWLIIFHIANLYTYKAFSNILEIIKRLGTALLIGFFITITIFYIFSRFFYLTPKANLVILTIIFGGLDILWRYLLRKIFIQKSHCTNVLILADSPLVKTIIDYINLNPQIGYSSFIFNFNINNIIETIQEKSIDLVVINGQSLKNNLVKKILYGLLPKQVEIIMFTDFYESLFGCIPLSEIEEEWFIREITENKNLYEGIKRLIEIISIIITLPISIPLIIIISLLIKITSTGPIIYKQERIGRGDKPFTLYKFRTMKNDQEGPLWTVENDSRITFIGKFLRRTHLDEIPQLLNIFKGEISFVGPRPERTKLVKMYGEIPYYEIRHLIKPGIIGWAQLNYKASTSIDEAKEKFQFDLYYLKNRSFILDLFILIKTIKMIFLTNK